MSLRYRPGRRRRGPRYFEGLGSPREGPLGGGLEVEPLACVGRSVGGVLYAEDAGIASKSAELGKEVRTQALRLKRRGNTWPTAEETGPLPVPEFKATRAWLDVAPLYMRGGGEWRVGGGRKRGGGGYEEGHRRGEAGRGERGAGGERKGEEGKEGGGSRECFFSRSGKLCPYMEKWGDCKFEHKVEKGGKDERAGGGRGEKRAAPGGDGAGEKKGKKDE